ncbi:MAG: ribosome maturation factor RimM [Pseudomonadales bacterium]|jgi:16S rRNA processing protein RimM|uniref:ribosome maturation factor RimM n=1 Tax=Halopseudomonas TaxID=2901189 RepID=UPI000C37AF7D|nr:MULTISPECIES: ribosome maturation factor RimM [Halopseudomonas]MAD27837.1 ribosome maturation factor RimM [Pseudomonadales bacterium]MEE2798810.1 ribosome maturation factor RimM [Pseudomonadota bacterium]HBO12366.1 ribosome maturation factor RimM [Halieaceae bacterium]HBT56876.1 ribosome maturation factor RimM [Pseudomonas sp.]MAH00282.1 ribosome maturation factor RimM [Pseudomonadales bacterium]|tara:strand:+ start:4206 stop:4748 length:543 start_codon:yes stop_codon:yes gene_type:complete
MANTPEPAGAHRVVLGKIVSVHGVRGAVKVYSHTDPLDNVLDYAEWSLNRGSEQRTVSVLGGRVQGRVLVVNLKGIDDRNKAEELVDFEISIASDALPELEDGDFYWHQLEGLQVVNQEGQLLGKVDHLLETGSNDVMVVKPCAGSVDQRERLLPYLPGQFVIKVDLETQVMQVDWDAEF